MSAEITKQTITDNIVVFLKHIESGYSLIQNILIYIIQNSRS